MKKMTKREAIKRYLEEHKNGITSMEAIQLFGDTRLSDTIFQLRKKENLNIVSENEIVTTRFGFKTYVSRYKLLEGENHEQF